MENKATNNILKGSTYFYNGGRIHHRDKQRIERLVVAATVTAIPSQAFERCQSLTTVILFPSDDCTFFIPDLVTSTSMSTSTATSTSSSDLTHTSMLQDIGNRAFFECPSLKFVTNVPPSLKRIGKRTFFNCNQLTDIDFSFATSLTVIESGAFVQCDNLTDVRLPDSVETLGQGAFSRCINLKSFSFFVSSSAESKGKKNTKVKFGEYLFSCCDKLEDVDISKISTRRISSCMFCACMSLRTIDLSYERNELEYIDPWAFSGCTTLQDINIPPFVKKIGSSAFLECLELKSVNFLGTAMKEIDVKAFCLCLALPTLTVPRSVKKIEREAFRDCQALTYVNLSEEMEVIESRAFEGCFKLTTIDYPDSPNGQERRRRPRQQQNRQILPNRVQVEDPHGSYSRTTSFGMVNFSASLKYIGNDAFWGCDKLAGMTVADDHQSSIHYFCDLNVGGRQFLPLAHTNPLGLWPVILNRALNVIELSDSRIWAKRNNDDEEEEAAAQESDNSDGGSNGNGGAGNESANNRTQSDHDYYGGNVYMNDGKVYYYSDNDLIRRHSIVYFLLIHSAGGWYNSQK